VAGAITTLSARGGTERQIVSYFLGIDLGTTYTAAAVWRDGRVEIACLGSRAPVIPSVVLLRKDGKVLTGEAAARRAIIEPDRIAREFKRRFGDPVPMIVAGSPYSAEALTALVLRAVVGRVIESQDGPPAGIAVSHPANWGEYKKDLLQQAMHLADLGDGALLTEPDAAAIYYASQERVDPGSVVAVYDLGGGSFDAAVLRRTGAGWQILGEPEGIERLGGVDFDEAVFRHVTSSLGPTYDSLEPDDPADWAAVTRLRQECIEAKEALAADTDVSIPVLLRTVHTAVRLTRAEFEAMIRPALGETVTAMKRALHSAAVMAREVEAVLLIGGSSRIPLVAQMVGSAFGRPLAVDAHPKHSVALGAAIIAADHASPGAANSSEVRVTGEALPAPAPTFWTAPAARTVAASRALPAGPITPRATPAVPPASPRILEDHHARRTGVPDVEGRRAAAGLLIAGVAALAVALGGVLMALRQADHRELPSRPDGVPANVTPVGPNANLAPHPTTGPETATTTTPAAPTGEAVRAPTTGVVTPTTTAVRTTTTTEATTTTTETTTTTDGATTSTTAPRDSQVNWWEPRGGPGRSPR
jgi:molecular chaperone DnaK